MNTVLIVEDNRHLSTLYSRIATRAGFRVIQVSSCAEALECLQNGRPDLVLLDIAMGDGSGQIIIEYIQSRAELRGTFVDIISGDFRYKSKLTFHKMLKIFSSKSNIVTFNPLQ